MIDFFISYSRVDSEFADKLYSALVGRGLAPWIDREKLEGGQRFTQEISQQIAQCKCFLILLSPTSIGSDWVEKEAQFALSQQKPIIPLNIANHAPYILLINYHYVDFTNQPFDRAVDNLVLAFRSGSVQKPQPNTPPVAIDKQKLYQDGSTARSRSDLEATLLYWNQILTQDPGYLGGTLAAESKKIEDQVRPQRISRIKASAQAAFQAQQWAELLSLLSGIFALDARGTADFALPLLTASADRCYRAGQWADEIALWQQVQRWQDDFPHAAERLQAAQTNESLTPRYTAARQFLAQGDRDLARQELTALWRDAPYYGDPAGLAKGLGLTVPISIIDVHTKQDEAAAAGKQRQQRIQQKANEEHQALAAKQNREREIQSWFEQMTMKEKDARSEIYQSRSNVFFNIGITLMVLSGLGFAFIGLISRTNVDGFGIVVSVIFLAISIVLLYIGAPIFSKKSNLLQTQINPKYTLEREKRVATSEQQYQQQMAEIKRRYADV